MPARLAILLLLSGCATVNHDLHSYVENFADEAKARGVDVSRSVSIQFVDSIQSDGPRTEAAAICTTAGVRVSEKFWEDSFWSEDTRRQVVYHELGHCLLGLEHEDRGRNPEAVSIMDPVLVGGPWYAAHEAQYLDAMFKKAKPTTTVEVEAIGAGL